MLQKYILDPFRYDKACQAGPKEVRPRLGWDVQVTWLKRVPWKQLANTRALLLQFHKYIFLKRLVLFERYRPGTCQMFVVPHLWRTLVGENPASAPGLSANAAFHPRQTKRMFERTINVLPLIVRFVIRLL
jgi:hypothetical protein